MAKRGRHTEDYRASWGETINGLARRPSDDRWRIIGTNITYTERDEACAVARYRRWQAKQAKQVIGFDKQVPPLPPVKFSRPKDKGEWVASIASFIFEPSNEPATITTTLPADVVWEKIRQLILKDPAEAESKTGIKGLARLIAQGPSGPGVTLERLWSLYEQTHKHITTEKLSAYEKCWKAFAAFVQVKTIDLISPDRMREYRVHILAKKWKPGYAASFFQTVRVVVNNAMKEGLVSDDLTRFAALAKMLRTTNGQNGCDPHPIEPADFKALLSVATDPLDRCLLLCGLNGSYYAIDLARLPGDAVDLDKGYIRFDRAKTGGTTRVCWLWKETVEAIRAYQRAKPHKARTLFVSRRGTALNRKSIHRHFIELRDRAGLSDAVKFGWLRDGCTCAQSAGVTGELIDVQFGHRLPGERDRYIKRDLTMVKPVADAMHKHYFGEPECVTTEPTQPG